MWPSRPPSAPIFLFHPGVLLCHVLGVPGGFSHICRHQFLQTAPVLVFLPLLIPVNMFQLIQFALALSRIEHSGCQPNIKATKKASPAPCSQFGRGGSVWASHIAEGKQLHWAPETQLGCTSDQQQITQGQRTKSHLYILLHRVSLHYLRENMFSSSLYSFPFALNSCCGRVN